MMPRRSTVVTLVPGLFLTAATAFAIGQPQKVTPPSFEMKEKVEAPGQVVLSGSDVGFRVEGYSNGTPVGRVVVKIDGKWVEPLPPKPRAVFVK